jgi:hypothetical protein
MSLVHPSEFKRYLRMKETQQGYTIGTRWSSWRKTTDRFCAVSQIRAELVRLWRKEASLGDTCSSLFMCHRHRPAT